MSFIGFSPQNEGSFLFNYTLQNLPYTIFLAQGYYLFEVWGAKGGDGYDSGQNYTTFGGLGGYSVGAFYVSSSRHFYVYVGAEGASSGESLHSLGGYNGGGMGVRGKLLYPNGGGGGATDIRSIYGEWNDTSSLNSRLIVAGGGGGGGASNTVDLNVTHGGAGGGLIGIDGFGWSSQFGVYKGFGGTQTSPGLGGEASCHSGNGIGDGAFGMGGSSNISNSCSSSGGGGGGGYYGGGGATVAGGGGGSGYIGGVMSFGSIIANTSSGLDTFPSPNGGYETGHSGNGFARISIIPNNIMSTLIEMCRTQSFNNLYSVSLLLSFMVLIVNI